MKAKLMRETEKAVQLTYSVEIYGEFFVVKSAWMPKSQIEINSTEDGVIDFTPKNDWILDAKTKDYCRYVAETLGNVKSEIATYLSRINTEKIDFCWV